MIEGSTESIGDSSKPSKHIQVAPGPFACFLEKTKKNTKSRSLGAGEMMMAPSTRSPWMRAVGPAALASNARTGDAMRRERPSSAMQMEAPTEMTEKGTR